MADKEQGSTEPNTAKHEEETVTNTGHVAKEKWGLHEAGHIWSGIVVIQAIAINEQASWSTTEERPMKHQIYKCECLETCIRQSSIVLKHDFLQKIQAHAEDKRKQAWRGHKAKIHVMAWIFPAI